MTTDERLKEWLSKLSEEQIRKVAYNSVSRLIEQGELEFSDYSEYPYWETTGDSVEYEDQ